MPLVATETELLGSPTLLSIPLRPGQHCRRPVRKEAKAAATWTCPRALASQPRRYKINIFILWNYYNCLPMRHLKGTCWLLFIQTHYCWITVERK